MIWEKHTADAASISAFKGRLDITSLRTGPRYHQPKYVPLASWPSDDVRPVGEAGDERMGWRLTPSRNLRL